jgi:hypothetical protein
MHSITIAFLAHHFGKWAVRSVFVVLGMFVLVDILRDVTLMGTMSHHETWPMMGEIMWCIIMTFAWLFLLWNFSTHVARRGVIVLLGADAAYDAILLGMHVETTYDGWTLLRDCLWLWAIFVLAVGSPPKESANVLSYPSVERIP